MFKVGENDVRDVLPNLEQCGRAVLISGIDQRSAKPAFLGIMIAPGQLPFAPRPIRGEVLSSWLMRVAAANLVQLIDLLEALETHHARSLPRICSTTLFPKRP
jgi:hypothetical protein